MDGFEGTGDERILIGERIQGALTFELQAQGVGLGGTELEKTGNQHRREMYQCKFGFVLRAEFSGEAGKAHIEEFLEFGGDEVSAGKGAVEESVAGGVSLALGCDGSARPGTVGTRGCNLFFGRHLFLDKT